MKREELSSDALMVAELAKELGISTLDLFIHWIKTGEIKNITLSVVFNDDDELKIDIDKNSLEEIIKPDSENLIENTFSDNKNVDSNSLPCTTTDVDLKSNTSQSLTSGTSYSTKETSFSRGTLHIKNGQEDNINIGAYVYTTGDILAKPNAIPNVNMRGIILDYNEQTITLIKCEGMGFTALEACSKEGKGWHFLSVEECKLLRKRREKINDSFLKIHRKQIDDNVLLLCQNTDKNLTVFDVRTQHVSDSLLPQKTTENRTFYVYMTKTMRIV